MEEIEKRKLAERAMELKDSGYNCAQAVACAFAERIGADEKQLHASTMAFGTGLTTTEGTCGALIGAGIVLGLAIPEKMACRGAMTEIMKEFKGRNGATICRELKGLETGCPLRACRLCVGDAAEFLAEKL